MQLLQHELNGRVYAAYPIPEEALSPYEERALRLGVSRGVLPVAFTGGEGRLHMLFDCEETELLTGYFRRERGRWDSQGDRLLGFGMRIVRGLLDAEEHFLPLAFFTLTEETVRIRPRDEAVFLLPDPGRERTDSGVLRLRSELADYLGALGTGLSDRSWNGYRERLLYEIREGRGGLSALYGTLERARGELYRRAAGENAAL